MKKKVGFDVVALFIVSMVSVIAYFYTEWKYPIHAVGQNVNRMINQKNYKQMKQVSENKTTYKLLKTLPSNAKVVDTTDPQGRDGKIIYYATTVKYKNKKASFDVNMKHINRFNWQIYSVKKN